MAIEPGRSVHVARGEKIAPLEDAALVERIRAGDEAAFEMVYRAYFAPLCQFVTGYRRTREGAEEIVQDVLWTVWQQRSALTLDRGGTLRSYLFASARHRAINVLKRDALETRWREQWASNADIAPLGIAERSIDPVRDDLSLPEAIDRALSRLSEPRRMLVRLRWQQGLSYAEIAAVLGISVKGVEVAINRVLRTLRASIRR